MGDSGIKMFIVQLWMTSAPSCISGSDVAGQNRKKSIHHLGTAANGLSLGTYQPRVKGMEIQVPGFEIV